MAEWKFGKKRVDLPADRFALDEDGWIEVRTRLTARDYQQAIASPESPLSFLSSMVLGWQLKIEGNEIPFDPEVTLDLPLEIVVAAAEAIDTTPLVPRTSALTNGLNASTGTTQRSKQDASQPKRSGRRT